ncbi:BpuSI family type II restriction endonuclease [Aliarcobacter skirrowii]|uniref:BpuSI family type II restriction endonuclease n=1 Tax=Aliarcobacter skirrowii TaxID=28200 RepID=UPI0029A49353|nr:BpuSI family type II restriction endonuclease [Aliarcobacter skirrowii]MDX4064034.1 BpuSI family type II restriction endonuclease [Aliarcobacter skirrowii]
MPLPQYNDGEVEFFHPIMEHALNIAINELEFEDRYEIQHHPRIGNIPPDFAIVSKHNNKFQLIVEVKRRPNDVVSTRYRHQAKSYVEEAGSLAEKKYYLLSNLEYSELFLHTTEQARSSVLLQQLEGGPYISGKLNETSEDEFIRNLVNNLKDIISLVEMNFSTYTTMSTKLYELLTSSCSSTNNWHQALMVCGYEWVRGVMSSVRRLPSSARSALTYRNQPIRLSRAGSQIDFEPLFRQPYPSSTNHLLWDAELLQEMYNHGRKWISGDELAIFAHEVVYKNRHHDGIVMTDPELSRLLSAVAKRIHNQELLENDKICDPAAGAGTLLTNIQYFFNDIQPRQIWANEKEIFLEDPLSIRIGLAYASVISPINAPKITINNILNLNREDFEEVKIILINPPYLRRVDCHTLCNDFANRILELTGEDSKTNVGQTGIEALFMELIYHLVQVDTTICCILPTQYLHLKGIGARKFRDFLVNTFELDVIVNYPMKGLFETVTKATSIFATKKGHSNNEIQCIEITQPLSDLNVTDAISLSNNTYGVEDSLIIKQNLQDKIQIGWSEFFGSNNQSISGIENLINDSNISFVTIDNSNLFTIKRGQIGNSGGTKLLFPNLNSTIWGFLESMIPSNWLSKGINDADIAEKANLLYADLNTYMLTPPYDAFINGTTNNNLLREIIRIFSLNQVTATAQRRNEKTVDEYINLIKSEKRKLSTSPVLVPRAIRRHARIFLINLNVYVSTNFVLLEGEEENKKLLTSWLMTSFAQLGFELNSSNREGMRKLEVGNVKETMIPNFLELTNENKQEIIEVFDNLGENQFIDLYNSFDTTELDNVWFRILWPQSYEEKKLEIIDYLLDITSDRNSMGNL